MVNTRYYILRSDQATYHNTDAGVYTFDLPADYSQSQAYNTLSMYQCVITNTFYQIANKTFIWTEDDGLGGTTQLTATLNGNYSISDMTSALKTAMDAQSSAGNGYTYTVTHNSVLNKITIAVSANTFSIDAGTLNTYLGYANNSGQSISHTGTTTVNLLSHTTLALNLDVVRPNTYDTSAGRITTITGLIPVSTSNTVTSFKPDVSMRMDCGHFSQINVRLTDWQFNPIDLNNGWFEVILRTEF